jgi:hypothetical protein
MRQIAREQLAREKAERQAAREAQQAQKAAESAKRREDAAEKKAQRMRQKNAIEKDAKSKKRPINAEELQRSVKRPCTHASRGRIATNSNNSTCLPNTTVAQLADNVISAIDSQQPSSRMRNAEEGQISRSLRSGRITRLPARFQQKNV